MTRQRGWGARRSTAAIACLLAATLAACGSSGKQTKNSTAFAPPPDPNAPPPSDVAAKPPKPWTTRFLEPGVLIADEIRIEGPAPLLDHVVTRPETEAHDVRVQTIPAGFEQTIVVRTPGAEVRAQIDQLVVSAMRRLVILERPGQVDVLVIAVGDVYWKDGANGAESRSQSLRIEGPIAR